MRRIDERRRDPGKMERLMQSLACNAETSTRLCLRQYSR